jgi:hypothetical protein
MIEEEPLVLSYEMVEVWGDYYEVGISEKVNKRVLP